MKALLALVPSWAQALIAVAVCAALAYGVHMVLEHFRDQGRAEVQAEWDLDKARRIKLTTDITNMYAAKAVEADERERKLNEDRNRRMVVATVAAKNLPRPDAAITVPASSVLVLNDAISDSAATTGPSAEPAKDSAVTAEGSSNIGLLTQWGVQCISAYEEARGMVKGWQDFYSDLRKAQ